MLHAIHKKVTFQRFMDDNGLSRQSEVKSFARYVLCQLPSYKETDIKRLMSLTLSLSLEANQRRSVFSLAVNRAPNYGLSKG